MECPEFQSNIGQIKCTGYVARASSNLTGKPKREWGVESARSLDHARETKKKG
jgi:hypothetical protein